MAFAPIAAVGCASEYDLVLLPGVEEAPRTPCDFTATADFPAAADFEEIGRLTVEFFPSHDLAAFKKSVAESVCHVGADVVVAMFDGARISEARLFRKVQGASSTSVSTSAPASSASP